MAKSEKTEHEEKPKKKHLHQIITEQAHDGSLAHHHVYKDSKDSHFAHPARLMATSSTPDEAGEHVADQFGASQQAPDQGGDQEADAGAGAAAAPGGGEAPPEGA